jgi:DNA-binding MarR family transcriptional regulator
VVPQRVAEVLASERRHSCLDVENLAGTLLRVRDEVDRLVEAWRHERPDLDLQPMEVLSRLSRLGHHLDRARRTAFAEHGLESWEFDVLAALRRAGSPYELSPGRLLKETLVTSGTMTNRVDRLEGRGLVVRLPDPGDRRGVLVRLTDAGRTTVDGALEGLLDKERTLLVGLDPARQRTLVTLLRTLVLPFEGEQP